MIASITITDSREQEIEGALASVVDHVDRVIVVDTGAKDGTIERARRVAQDKLIVVEHAWVDFAAARNFGLETAMRSGAEWGVIVDTDERLDLGAVQLETVLRKTKAEALLVESVNLEYSKPKIVRLRKGVRFYGPTHEALLALSQETLRGAMFDELPKTDARFKAKCERDVALLLPFIDEHPNDPRWWYYLGTSYEGLGQLRAAANAFSRCVQLRRVGPEAAWSAYKEAEQLMALDRPVEAAVAAARGVGADATSAECAYLAAKAALEMGRKDQAVAWARIAEAVGRYKGCGADRQYFRHLPALYELPYTILRSALPASGERAEAGRDFERARMARIRAATRTERVDLERLSVTRSAHMSVRQEARAMLRPPRIAELCPSAKAAEIVFEPPDGLLPTNPSVCNHNGALWCNVRLVNYTMSGRSYTVHDPHGIVRTQNYLGRLAPDGTLIKPRLVRDLDKANRFQSRVRGYEDVRLVSIGRSARSTLVGSATVCDRYEEFLPRIARLHLTAAGDVRQADVQPSNQAAEKNWMPLSVDGEFAWVYSLDPTAILPGPLNECPLALDHVRGGAAIKYKSGYLCVAHEAIDADEGRTYLHRFVKLDKGFNVTAVSRTWVFAHHGIEFAAGLAKSGGTLVISYGIEDREAWIIRVSVKEVEAMEWITP